MDPLSRDQLYFLIMEIIKKQTSKISALCHSAHSIARMKTFIRKRKLDIGQSLKSQRVKLETEITDLLRDEMANHQINSWVSYLELHPVSGFYLLSNKLDEFLARIRVIEAGYTDLLSIFKKYVVAPKDGLCGLIYDYPPDKMSVHIDVDDLDAIIVYHGKYNSFIDSCENKFDYNESGEIDGRPLGLGKKSNYLSIHH